MQRNSRFPIKTITTGILAIIFYTATTVLTQGDLKRLFAQDEFYIVTDGKQEGGIFGISNVIVNRGGGKAWILIGDPDTIYNTSSKEEFKDTDTKEPVQGQVLRCDWNGENNVNETCIALRLNDFQAIIESALRKKLDQSWVDTSAAKFGFTVVHGHNATVVCGPTTRFRIVQKSKKLTFLPGGCYTINDDELDKTDGNLNCGDGESAQCRFIKPEKSNRTFSDSSSSRMLGFSADVHPNPNNSTVILGAPEQFKVTGGAVEVSINKPGEEKWQRPPNTAQYERAGWAVKVGHNNWTEPRYFLALSTVDNRRTRNLNNTTNANETGGPAAVYILKYEAAQDVNNSKGWMEGGVAVLSNETEGMEYGAFFGYSLETVDVDNKTGTEVLVGAPFHSGGTMFDRGCVMVIDVALNITSQSWQVNGMTPLFPDKSTGDVRFGSSISKVGDLDKDGFQDVAIGAPLEGDKGVVYLFCGSANGLKQCGKLTPEDHRNMTNRFKYGFGYSIFGGADLDGNGTPDMIVGWVGTGAVAIYRSRYNINYELYYKVRLPEDFTSEKISLSFNVTVLSAHGVLAGEKALDFIAHMKIKDPKYFLLSKKNTATLKMQRKNVTTTESFSFVITRTKEAIEMMDAIEATERFGLEYKVVYQEPRSCSSERTVNGSLTVLEKNCSTANFCPTCPFSKETNWENVTVEFCRRCDDGIRVSCQDTKGKPAPVCVYDVTIGIESLNHTTNSGVLPLDNFKELHIRTSVNTNDTFHEPNFIILVESDGAEFQYRVNTSAVFKPQSLVSTVRNFTANQFTGKKYLSKGGLTMDFVIPLKNMTASTNRIHDLNIMVELSRGDRFQYKSSVRYQFLPDASVELSSESKAYTLQPGLPTESSRTGLNMKFRVRYQGKSKTRSELRFLFPLCYLEEVESESASHFIERPKINNWDITCVSVKTSEDDFTFTKVREAAETEPKYKCPSKRRGWLFYSCHFVNRKENENYLIEFPVNVYSEHAAKFISTSSGSTSKVYGIGFIQALNDAVDPRHWELVHTEVEIKFSIESIPFWMILVAIGVGVLIFIILVGVLFKLGFFRRKVKEELENLKAGAAQNAEKDQNGESDGMEMEGFETVELNQMDENS